MVPIDAKHGAGRDLDAVAVQARGVLERRSSPVFATAVLSASLVAPVPVRLPHAVTVMTSPTAGQRWQRNRASPSATIQRGRFSSMGVELVEMWGLTPAYLVHDPDAHELLTLITSLFVHETPWQLLGGALAVTVLWTWLTPRIGALRFGLALLVSGIVAGLVQSALQPERIIAVTGAWRAGLALATAELVRLAVHACGRLSSDAEATHGHGGAGGLRADLAGGHELWSA